MVSPAIGNGRGALIIGPGVYSSGGGRGGGAAAAAASCHPAGGRGRGSRSFTGLAPKDINTSAQNKMVGNHSNGENNVTKGNTQVQNHDEETVDTNANENKWYNDVAL